MRKIGKAHFENGRVEEKNEEIKGEGYNINIGFQVRRELFRCNIYTQAATYVVIWL